MRIISTLVAASMWLMTMTSASAQKQFHRPYAKKAQKVGFKAAQPLAAVPFNTVVDEDFSRFTAGSETSPVKADFVGEDQSIDASKMSSGGWIGNGIYEAGGVCYLGEYEYDWYGEVYKDFGFISTPEMALYGDIEVTFRAKRAAGAKDGTHIYVALCDNYSGPIETMDAMLTTEWQTFEFKSNQATFNDYNIMQFAAYEGAALIDDIVVKRAVTKIETPYANDAINNSKTSFTASWSKVADAKDYLLSVYYKAMPENGIPSQTVKEDFEGINLKADGKSIDTENPNYPKGWEVSVSTYGAKDMETAAGHFNSGKQALHLDEVGDYFMTPKTPAPINFFSFWVKPSSMEMEEYPYSMISIEVFADGQWTPIANLPNYYLSDGGYYDSDINALGEGVTQIRVSYIQKNMDTPITFAIDDVTYTYASQPVPYEIFTDKAVADTFCVVNDLDLSRETYYYVKARNGELLSDASYPVWVDGLRGMKPTLLPATGAGTDAFSANWEAMPHATAYKVNVYKGMKGNSTDDVVLLHETFDNITEGTVEEPGYSYSQVDYLSKSGKTDTDWLLQLPYYANGMAGAQAATWSGIAGLVVSPRMSLDNAGGTFEVDVKAYMTQPEDQLFVMILKEHTDKVATDAVALPFEGDQPGELSATAHFEARGLKDIKIAFMSMYSMPFFIDEVTIRQKLNTGEMAYAPYKTVHTSETSHDFDLVSGITDYAYSVTASTSKNYMDYVSDESDMMLVDVVTAIDAIHAKGLRVFSNAGNICVDTPAATDIKVYDSNGRFVCGTNAAAGITTLPARQLEGNVAIVKVGNQTLKLIVE